MSTPQLETERVILLPWESEDWLAFKPIATDPRVMRYISDGVPWQDEKIVEFAERQTRHFANLGYCLWKLFVKGESELAGFCGLQPLDDLPGVEIGWWLAGHEALGKRNCDGSGAKSNERWFRPVRPEKNCRDCAAGE